MPSLLIANILSFITACFTVASSFTRNPQRTYWYQVGQCLVYTAAAFFFGVYATMVMMLITAFRNYLVASRKYTMRWMILCAAASLILGSLINGHSLAEYISVILAVYYTITSFFMTSPKAVKINLAIDLGAWFAYDVLVRDIPSGIMDCSSVILALVTLWRICLDENTVRRNMKHET